MRMGKPEKLRRGEKKPPRVDAKGKPRHAARGSVVGKLSPDILSTYFIPELLAGANSCLETYSDDLLKYHDSLGEAQGEAGNDTDTDSLSPPNVPLYRSQYWVQEFEEMLTDTSKHFHSKEGAWKVHAKAARFERLMDEKYGKLRPFIQDYPEVEQFVRSLQRKYASGYFSPFRQGKPPIPKSTAVIILFMMARGGVRWEITTLSFLFFLVGLQPWALVVLVAGVSLYMDNRKRKPCPPMKKSIPLTKPYFAVNESFDGLSEESQKKVKVEAVLRPVGTTFDADKIDVSEFDTLLLGSGPATLYVGALLSRANRRVMVLSPQSDASGCREIDVGTRPELQAFRSVPFDIEHSNVSKVSKQQALLSAALCNSNDSQGGIRFAQIGSEDDGFAFEVLAVPGMGTDGGDTTIPFILRADGMRSLMDDAALNLGDGWPDPSGDVGSSTTGSYVATCEAINASSNLFYLSKVLTETANNMRSSSPYQDSSIRFASSFLDKGFPLNAHTRSLLAAIGMKGENIKPSMTSMGAHVTNVSAALGGEGMHYPVGGPRALCHALASVIEQSGGIVCSSVPTAELIFERDTLAKSVRASQDKGQGGGEHVGPPPRCVGVRLADKREMKFDMSRWREKDYAPAVISMFGFVTTFIRLMPEAVRVKHKVPRGLPALSEQRPVFKVLFALDGSSFDLDLTGADYYRVPGAALAQDEVDPVTGEIKLGEIGWIDGDGSETEVKVEDVNKEEGDKPPGTQQAGEKKEKGTTTSKLKKKRRAKFEAGMSWIHITFPSAKDPSFRSRHGDISTCVVTIEADDDFVTPYDTKPKLFSVQKGKVVGSGESQRLMERIQRDLLDIYPQLGGKILHSQLVGPVYRGLSHGPERYAAKGVRPKTPYPGLFVGGPDLTVGESFSGSIVGGWMAANAVMEYTTLDYVYLHRNITTDIAQFIEPSDTPDDEDVAVPFSEETTIDEVDEKQADE